jgi:hypothetical protein
MSTEGGGGSRSNPNWYEPASNSLEQGDLLLDFPLILPTVTSEGEVAVLRKKTHVAILTQSCDIAKPTQKTLLLVQVFEYGEVSARPENSHLKTKEYIRGLREGAAICDFLLPPGPFGSIGYGLISFRHLFVLPKSYVEQQAPALSGLTLRSPYKEHFSQAYARFMMRVGLPDTLREFNG